MRTTVTLDEDVVGEIRQLMRECGVGFKQIINELLRRGLRAPDGDDPYSTPVFDLGVRPGIDLNKALELAAAMDDEVAICKFEVAK
ncbi:MAG: hypothetical protein V9F03_03400 [Microthrixaceae bacterium]